MPMFEIISFLLSSSILIGTLALFYRFGRNQECIDNSFKAIDEKLKAVDERFNKMDERFDKVDSRLNRIDERFNSLETRMAIVETRLGDIATNVSRLMWHSQSVPPKEVSRTIVRQSLKSFLECFFENGLSMVNYIQFKPTNQLFINQK
ncbi:hypothetical protein [Candidatus Protochlamydia sp. R18]|uniref:hypothetical protein n=1 Tax=Candidatus Protochlamydia sp. R18 TaxID=1353977 RepID=UPI0005A93AD2|nr:hypothetical protein [Candidatus Protochlamydia sp. R18]